MISPWSHLINKYLLASNPILCGNQIQLVLILTQYWVFPWRNAFLLDFGRFVVKQSLIRVLPNIIVNFPTITKFFYNSLTGPRFLVRAVLTKSSYFWQFPIFCAVFCSSDVILCAKLLWLNIFIYALNFLHLFYQIHTIINLLVNWCYMVQILYAFQS